MFCFSLFWVVEFETQTSDVPRHIFEGNKFCVIILGLYNVKTYGQFDEVYFKWNQSDAKEKIAIKDIVRKKKLVLGYKSCFFSVNIACVCSLYLYGCCVCCSTPINSVKTIQRQTCANIHRFKCLLHPKHTMKLTQVKIKMYSRTIDLISK